MIYQVVDVEVVAAAGQLLVYHHHLDWVVYDLVVYVFLLAH